MRIGSLCSGYGGLDLGVTASLGGSVAWHCEYDPAPARVLQHRWPGVPNYKDITTVDWAAVEPVDVLTAGYPCQPFSLAGKRAGSDDERHLWPFVAAAIGHLRPGRVVLENVAGHVSLGLGAVVGDLAGMGYDARWGVVRASASGAPHRRARVFIVAADAGGEALGLGPGLRQGRTTGVGWGRPDDDVAPAVADPDGLGWGEGRAEPAGRIRGPAVVVGGGAVADPHSDAVREQPVPVAGCCGAAVAGLACLHPAPADPDGQGPQRGEPEGRRDVPAWGAYEPAIRRWEHATGRPAPWPTEPGRNGRPRLSPAFVEWMMGLPAGWVTDVPGIPRSYQLKALGNGVVPQQAALALQLLGASA